MKKKKIAASPVPLVALADQSITAEKYRTIRSNIQFAAIDRELNTAANLAVVFANSGKQVLLVDADLRKPTVALSFQLPHNEGLSNLLSERERIADDYITETHIENLWILPSGPKPPNPSEVLGTKRMEEIIEELILDFDLVIFDMPPVATVTDAQILAAKTDGTLLVVRERKTKKQELLKAKELLQIAKANILGVVYNGTKKESDLTYYYQSFE